MRQERGIDRGREGNMRNKDEEEGRERGSSVNSYVNSKSNDGEMTDQGRKQCLSCPLWVGLLWDGAYLQFAGRKE